MRSIRYSGLLLTMRGRGGGWLRSLKVLGNSGLSWETWNTGWIRMVEGRWRVNNIVEGCAMMGKGLIFLSVTHHAHSIEFGSFLMAWPPDGLF